MNKLRFPKFSLGSFFSRNAYDPTSFEDINEPWDDATSAHRHHQEHKSGTTQFQNYNLPLAGRIEELKHKLAQYDEAIPNRKKINP